MALETAIGYLVALSVPLWLVFEAFMSWENSPEKRGSVEAAEQSLAATRTTVASHTEVTAAQSRIAA